MPYFWILVLLLLALFQITNAVTVLHLPNSITASASLPLPVNVALSIGWSLLLLVGAVYLGRQRQNAVRYARWLIVGFILYSLLRLVIWARAAYDRERLLFLCGLSLVVVLLFVWQEAASRIITRGEEVNHDDQSID